MKIKYTRQRQGKNFTIKVGTEADVSQEKGERLIANAHAIEVKTKKKGNPPEVVTTYVKK